MSAKRLAKDRVLAVGRLALLPAVLCAALCAGCSGEQADQLFYCGGAYTRVEEGDQQAAAEMLDGEGVSLGEVEGTASELSSLDIDDEDVYATELAEGIEIVAYSADGLEGVNVLSAEVDGSVAYYIQTQRMNEDGSVSEYQPLSFVSSE